MFNKIFFSVLCIAALFGFILPYLVSAKSNELTILGFLIIIGLLYTAGRFITRAFNSKENE